ncbi:TIGR02300 family protein [Rhodospirillaceae bacterium SYSU D60014]|uniref:TIGR02300 family protein n=1 Tax=Virgifigura deserti TaxID=2268457 RepID=UPI000E660108
MVKPSWGTKRICQSCGARFYDLQRDPIICPKCSAVHDPEAILKTRRGRSVVAEKAPAAVKPVVSKKAVPVPDAEEVEAGDEDLVLDEESEEDEDLIEDASELGEDDDDMAEVIENVDEEEER